MKPLNSQIEYIKEKLVPNEVLSKLESKLPRYKSHKQVRAASIKNVNGGQLTLDVDGEAVIHNVDLEMFSRYQPEEGDYFMLYEDGYQSICPKNAFEGGYLRMGKYSK